MYAITGRMLGSHDSEDCERCEDNEGVCLTCFYVIAGKIFRSGESSECERCEDNEGVCHRLAMDDVRYDETEELCECPVSRAGNFCQEVRG